MALILSVRAQKRLFIENFSNLRRAINDIMYNRCTVEVSNYGYLNINIYYLYNFKS